MSLTAEQIQQNWVDLEETIKLFISEPRRSQLLDFYSNYSDRLMLMPASHKKEYHNAFPGGYVDHVLRVVDCALKLNDVWVEMGVDDSTYTKEELVFAALNHDLGKLGDDKNEAYLPQDDQWRRDKLGEDYKFNDRLEFMSVPDRSLHLLSSNGIQMSKNEWLAIKLHDGLYDDANKPYLMSWSPETKPRTSLIYIVHQADLMAARIEFEKVWNPKLKGEVKKTNNFSVTKAPKQTIKTKTLGSIESSGLMNMLNDL